MFTVHDEKMDRAYVKMTEFMIKHPERDVDVIDFFNQYVRETGCRVEDDYVFMKIFEYMKMLMPYEPKQLHYLLTT